MREIKFEVNHNGEWYYPCTIPPLHRDAKGWYKNQGYVLRLVDGHPFADNRGYVREHRLIMEEHLLRFLLPTEFIHHINQIRDDNRLENLVLQGQGSHASKHMVGERNQHGQFICQESIFQEIKFRLLNTNTNQMRIYTLQELIATTYRRGQFRYRGRWTGLKDKNGKEIYEGDIIRFEGIGFVEYEIGEVVWSELETWGAHEPTPFCWNLVGYRRTSGEFIRDGDGKPIISEVDECLYDSGGEVIGNIWENPELLETK